MSKKHTPEEIKYRLSDLGVQIGDIAIEYISDLEKQIEKMKCCGNCANDDNYDFYDDTWHDACGDCENQCNWKLKE